MRKVCSLCGEAKPETEYHRDARSSDGRTGYCKACNKTRASAWYAANLKKAKTARAAAYAANPEKAKARANSRRLANPAKVKAEKAAWFAANREKLRPARRAWAAANPEKRKTMAALRYAADPAKVKAINDAWRSRNPEKAKVIAVNRRARKRGASGRHSAADIASLFSMQRGKCAHPWCRSLLTKKLHVDHILPLALGGSNDRTNLQLLCQTCNCSKGAKHPIDFAQRHGMLL